jgi:hypothetical protein
MEHGWVCSEIRTDTDVRTFTVDVPYWECEGSAIPRGRAVIAIQENTANPKSSTLSLLIYWFD